MRVLLWEISDTSEPAVEPVPVAAADIQLAVESLFVAEPPVEMLGCLGFLSFCRTEDKIYCRWEFASRNICKTFIFHLPVIIA